MSTSSPGEQRPTGLIVAIAVLLAAPIVALMWVGSYAKEGPEFAGFPFFYWYQFLWVFLAAICTSIAYRLVTRIRGERPAPHGGPGQEGGTR